MKDPNKDQDRKQRDRQVVTMALGGTGHAVIADAVGLATSTVSYICRKHGLHCRPRGKSTRGQKRNEEIRSLVSAGVDTKKIADRFGLSRSRITQICIEGGMRRRMKRTKTNGDNSFGSRTAETFPGMGDIAANLREVDARPAPEPPAPEPPEPETPGEHPEARRWRLQLCEEQGRRLKLERENKALRGVLADTLKRFQDLEYEIEEHRAAQCDADVCCCDFLGV